MTSIRKAKKLKIKDFKETGFRVRWSGDKLSNKEEDLNKFDDDFISFIESLNLIFCGGMNHNKNRGVYYGDGIIAGGEKYHIITEEEIEAVKVYLIKVGKIVEVSPSFDINLKSDKDYPLFEDEKIVI